MDEDNWMGPGLCGRAPTEAVREEVKGQWFEPLDVWMEKCTEQRRNGQGGEKKVQRSPVTLFRGRNWRWHGSNVRRGSSDYDVWGKGIKTAS